jgi:hypothetical protein
MTVTMIKRRRDDRTLHLTGLVHARALFEARGATPEGMEPAQLGSACVRRRGNARSGVGDWH